MNLESSGKVLLLSNILAMVVVVLLDYEFAVLVWVYWLESVVMGVFAFLKLLMSGIRQTGTLPVGIFLALFFAVHYGMFHLAYLIFLLTLPWFSIDPSEVLWIFLAGGIFFASHAYSFYGNVWKKPKDIPAGPKATKLQFIEPYSRILPIHVTIILAGISIGFFGIGQDPGLLLLFMGLKTASDLYFHMLKHKMA
jgi:hypothetical protein